MTCGPTPPGYWFDTNVERAGELFLKALWIQGQMADLLIFSERPDLIAPFHATPTELPGQFIQLRFEKWEKLNFGPTKDAFIATFGALLADADSDDLEYLSALRNAIGHAHVSMGRDYFLYRPRTNREAAAIEGLALPPREGAMEPSVIKLAFYDDEFYMDCFNRIKRLDEGCLRRVATAIGVQQSRIR
ncbi:hypothetical protein [Nocardioides aquiterrae]|uniref:Transcriptional regulator n=1 Tax=Nocardioides aquiterrae TaxID=203799 RepID=A0ABP4F2T1_9ACTN